VAGVELRLADALNISPASVQKWRAGQPIARKHLPALAAWAVQEAGMTRPWLRSFLLACDWPERDLETRLFGPAATAGPPGLAAACQAANLRLWGHDRLDPTSLYFPRPALHALIESFLLAEPPGLILVGASGLGKTSLTLWLACHAAQACPERSRRIGRPVLAYPARLLDGATPLPDLLTQTLGPSLNGPAPGDPLAWPILVILDGINESLEMTRLTWQVDRALVNAQADAQGLKVILTFRPESFRIVRQGLTLSRHCYFTNLPLDSSDATSTRLSAGLACEPPAVRLLPLAPAELPTAYDLYRQAYRLQTPFPGLPAALKESIRHPLTLRLLAETYEGQRVPDSVEPEELIPVLLETLVAHGRLQRGDVRWIEAELMPRLVAPGSYRQAVPREEIAGPDEAGPLTRLADAGLLASTNGRLDEPLRFAHERFYEHLAWRRLKHLRATTPDPAAFYADLTAAPLALHAPLRRLVAEEIAHQPARRLGDVLADLPEPLLIGGLEDWCLAHPGEAPARLRHLWRLYHPWERLARLGLPFPSPSPRQQRLQRAIIAVAAALGDVDLLQRALLTAGPAVQPAAVSETLSLWRSDPPAAQRLLNDVGERVLNRFGLPNQAALGAFVPLTLQTLFDYGQQVKVRVFLLAQLQALARRAFGGLRGRVLRFILVHQLTNGLKHGAEGYLIADLDVAFRLSQAQQTHLIALARFMDWETPGLDTDATYEHLRAALDAGNILADVLVTACLIVHGLARWAETAAVVRRLLSEARETHPYPPWADAVLHTALEILYRHPCADPELWALLDEGVLHILGGYPAWHEAYRASRLGPRPALRGPAQLLAPYLLARDAAGRPVDAGPVWALILRQLAAEDQTFALDYLSEVRYIALDSGRPRLALRLLEPVARCQAQPIQEALADLLARVRLVATEDVREFLEQSGSATLAALVRARPVERQAYDWLYYRLEEWIYPFLIESRPARRLAGEILAQAARSTSTHEWLGWSTERVLHALMEGEETEEYSQP